MANYLFEIKILHKTKKFIFFYHLSNKIVNYIIFYQISYIKINGISKPKLLQKH